MKNVFAKTFALAFCVLVLLAVFVGCSERTGGFHKDHIDNTTSAQHKHSYSEWEVVTDPTCAEAGQKKIVCSTCGAEDTESISPTEHKIVKDLGAEATCTEDGVTEGSHCEICGAVLVEQQIVPATGHSFGSWVTMRSSTCTTTGQKKQTCSTCGVQNTESIPSTGHTIVKDDAVKATCTEAGKTEGSHCKTCKSVIVVQKNIPATGHYYGSWVTLRSPTCTTDGQRVETCSVCGVKNTESIPSTGHMIIKDLGVEATCTEDGITEGSHCEICGAVLVEQQIIPALGHSFGSDNKCVRCDYQQEFDMTQRLSAPTNDDLYLYGNKFWDSWGFECTVKNTSGKTIKYATIKVRLYNTVMDVKYTCSVKITGPFNNGDTLDFGKHCSSDFLIWNSGLSDIDKVGKVETVSVTLEYDDGTSETGPFV